MDINKLISTTPESLAREQYLALQAHAVATLKGVIHRINSNSEDELKELDDNLGVSTSGDGYGSENEFIVFGEGPIEDIGGVVTTLLRLGKLSNSFKKSTPPKGGK